MFFPRLLAVLGGSLEWATVTCTTPEYILFTHHLLLVDSQSTYSKNQFWYMTTALQNKIKKAKEKEHAIENDHH
jgi:hypothetical protein